MRSYDFQQNPTWLLRCNLMVFWLISFLYMNIASVTASESSISVSPIWEICTFAQKIQSSDSATAVDKQFSTQIVDACKLDSRHPLIVGDIQSMWENLFKIQDPTLFEAVLYLLPRNRMERWDFAQILENHKDDIVKKLGESQTKLSRFLRARFFVDQFTILRSEKDKEEFLKIADGWKDYTDVYTPYIDAYAYFITGKWLDPELTFAQAMGTPEVFVNGRSNVKYIWNRKQALMAIRQNNPWVLTEAMDNIRTLRTPSDALFEWFLSSDFVEAFSLHPEFLKETYFNSAYVSFMEDIIVLKAWVKNATLSSEPEKYFTVVERLISLIETQELGSWDKFIKYWWSGGSPFIPIIDTLMSLAESDSDWVKAIIAKHPTFFDQSDIITFRDQMLDTIKKKELQEASTRGDSAWVVQNARDTLSNDDNRAIPDSVSNKKQQLISVLFWCAFLLLVILLITFIKKHR